jgi:hypothetical protein
MITNVTASQIINYKPKGLYFTKNEKTEFIRRIEEFIERHTLGQALDALWQQQKNIGFILGTPIDGENITDKSKFLIKNIGHYQLVHSPARKDRKNISFLRTKGIISENPRFVYEHFDGVQYSHFPCNHHGYKDVCFLCSAAGANPNEIVLSVLLAGSEFIYGANYATLGHSHFTVWSRVPILQKYWPMDTLIWLCENGDKLKSNSFTTFFNGLGAGNSIRHFHYQTLKEKFPVMDFNIDYKLSDKGISRLKWPIPAYCMSITRKDDRYKLLYHLDVFISAWLNISRDNTLNLAHSIDEDGTAKIVFIPRINKADKRRPKKMSNDFGGCEVCGRMNIEDFELWNSLIKCDSNTISKIIRELAPFPEQIERIETQTKE